MRPPAAGVQQKTPNNTPREPVSTPRAGHTENKDVAHVPTSNIPPAISSAGAPAPEGNLFAAERATDIFFEGNMADFDPPPLTAQVAVTTPSTPYLANHVMAGTPREQKRGVVGLVPPR